MPHESLRLLTPGEGIGRYTFNRHAIAHRFCPTCGMHPFGEDTAEGPQRSAYVNLRCVEELDLDRLEVIRFDGRSAL